MVGRWVIIHTAEKGKCELPKRQAQVHCLCCQGGTRELPKEAGAGSSSVLPNWQARAVEEAYAGSSCASCRRGKCESSCASCQEGRRGVIVCAAENSKRGSVSASVKASVGLLTIVRELPKGQAHVVICARSAKGRRRSPSVRDLPKGQAQVTIRARELPKGQAQVIIHVCASCRKGRRGSRVAVCALAAERAGASHHPCARAAKRAGAGHHPCVRELPKGRRGSWVAVYARAAE